MKRTAARQGFTLIEILIVVGIIGVLAAIAIWNYFVAIDRSKTKKTMEDMRTIAVAWEARATDRGMYNAAGQSGGTFAWPPEPVTASQLESILVPTYVRELSKQDAWGHGYEFAVDQPIGSANTASIYAIRASGKDGVFESSYTPGVTTSFDCDIVYSNGSFIVRPKTE